MESYRQRYYSLLFGLTLWLAAFCNVAANDNGIPNPPNPPRLVNDLAGMLKPDELDALEAKTLAFYKQSSTQVVTVITPTLNNYDPADFAFKLGEKWGVGKKGKNNGVILLISLQPRKIFIATGYGTEEFLTDAYCKRIIETIIKPEFKLGKFYNGIDKGIDAIFLTLQGKFKPNKTENTASGFFTLFIIIILLIIIFFIASKLNKNNRRGVGGFGSWGGGYWGGGGWTTLSSGRGHWGSSSGEEGAGFDGFGGGSFGGGGAGGDW